MIISFHNHADTSDKTDVGLLLDLSRLSSYTGVTRVIFQPCSTIPLIRELLKILVTDGVSSVAAIRSNLLYMSNLDCFPMK